MDESGLWMKSFRTAIDYSFEAFGGFKYYFPEEKNKFVVTLFDSKIAFGPFIIGILLSILIIIIEVIISIVQLH